MLDGRLPASVTVTEAPAPITLDGHDGVQMTLRHDGSGLESCASPCVAPLFQSSGRAAYLRDGVPRRFTILDVDGSPVVIVTIGGIGDALLQQVTIDPSE